jgi:hypothetical protein
MELQAFLDRVRQEPETIDVDVLADVHPKPWVTRHGSGADTRALMNIGGKGLWYERQQGDTRWDRVDDLPSLTYL